MASYSLVELYRRFRDVYCLHHQGDDHHDYGGNAFSETSVYLYETTRRHIIEGCRLHTRRREDLKYYSVQ
jgi:hypothetical protein